MQLNGFEVLRMGIVTMSLELPYSYLAAIEHALCKYSILWDIVDPLTESNPNPNPNPEPNPKPNPNPNPNPNPEPNPKPNANPNHYPNCGFTVSHKMKYLRCLVSCLDTISWAQNLAIGLPSV